MNWRGLATYTIPKIDVLISGILRSQANTEPLTIETGVATNGLGIAANYTVTPAILAANGQTPFAPGVTTQSVNLVPNSSLFADRVNSVDMRFGKILRFGGTRTNIGIDLYNMFNSNVGTAFNQGFGTDGATWMRPTAVLNPRFARFNVHVRLSFVARRPVASGGFSCSLRLRHRVRQWAVEEGPSPKGPALRVMSVVADMAVKGGEPMRHLAKVLAVGAIVLFPVLDMLKS